MTIKLTHPLPDLTRVDLGPDLTVWFSFEALVGFRNGDVLFVAQNQWSNKTGRHLNTIDGGDRQKRRIPQSELITRLTLDLDLD